MFAKLASDLLTLRNGEVPYIFDTDNPDGSLLNHFAGAGKIVDIKKVAEQVAIFDTLLRPQPKGQASQHFVIDLMARHQNQFFEIYHDISFEEGAADMGLNVSVFYMIDRTEASINRAEKLARSLQLARFIPIRNGAIGDVLDDWHMAKVYQSMRHEREIILPKISPSALAMLEHPEFHFDTFVAGRYDHFPYELKSELWGFLESLYEQRESTDDVAAHPV